MFQILYPLGLLAALGILIPVLIHLWNVKTGKTLKIGSVFLLGTPSNQRSRSFRVQDWPLLLLRCLIIFLAALVLSVPVMHTREKVTKAPGWILVEKSGLSELWKSHRFSMDSLIKAGYEIHDLAQNFEKIDLNDTTTVFSRSSELRLPYYSLFRQLEVLLPNGTSVYFFAKGNRSDFDGPQVDSKLDLHWKILPPDSSQLNWTAATYQLANGRVRKMEANASSNGTYYTIKDLLSPAAKERSVDTSTVLIQIYAGKNAEDATYVRAATAAISAYTQRKIKIRNVSSVNAVTRAPGVLFWLSEEKLSPAVLRDLNENTTVFYYAGTKVQSLGSVIRDNSSLTTQPAELYQRTVLESATTIGQWEDGTGTPLLLHSVQTGVNCLGFYSRFKPEWTDMVWSNELVRYLLPIILPDSEPEKGFEDAAKLPVSADELNYAGNRVKSTSLSYKVVEYALDSWIWYALLMAFLIERVVTHNRKKASL